MKQYIWNLLIAIDQLFNAILAGDPDETLSSRMGKKARQGHLPSKIICRCLDLIDKDHCEKSIERDEGEPM